jgi:hypothetical protein
LEKILDQLDLLVITEFVQLPNARRGINTPTR